MQHVITIVLQHGTTVSMGAVTTISMQALSNQQLQEARDEAAGLHMQLANLKASQQQVQANQVRSTVASQWCSMSTLNLALHTAHAAQLSTLQQQTSI